MLKRILISLLLLLVLGNAKGQPKNYEWSKSYSDTIRKGRAIGLGVGAASLWAGSVIGLNQLWYAQEERSKFHVFDDSRSWMQIDKAGHFFSSYAIGYYLTDMMRWAGFKRKTSIWVGGFTGSFFLLGIEVLDGLSETWGFSLTDFTANTCGSFAFVIQELAWNEQRITPKISYHNTRFAQYRPEQLGSNFAERMMKDYNGHTFWFSVNVHSFLDDQSKFPRWLNFAIGFGANGMLGGTENSDFDPLGNPLPSSPRYRQFYLSLDVDLTKIRTKKKWLRTIFKAVNLIKIPFPTVEFNPVDKAKFHPVYF